MWKELNSVKPKKKEEEVSATDTMNHISQSLKLNARGLRTK